MSDTGDVVVRSRVVIGIYKDFASLSVPMTNRTDENELVASGARTSPSNTLMSANPLTSESLVDPENKISVTFRLATFDQENLEQAASQLENKKVVYSKIGKVKRILPAVKVLLDALEDVSFDRSFLRGGISLT